MPVFLKTTVTRRGENGQLLVHMRSFVSFEQNPLLCGQIQVATGIVVCGLGAELSSSISGSLVPPAEIAPNTETQPQVGSVPERLRSFVLILVIHKKLGEPSLEKDNFIKPLQYFYTMPNI